LCKNRANPQRAQMREKATYAAAFPARSG